MQSSYDSDISCKRFKVDGCSLGLVTGEIFYIFVFTFLISKQNCRYLNTEFGANQMNKS